MVCKLQKSKNITKQQNIIKINNEGNIKQKLQRSLFSKEKRKKCISTTPVKVSKLKTVVTHQNIDLV